MTCSKDELKPKVFSIFYEPLFLPSWVPYYFTKGCTLAFQYSLATFLNIFTSFSSQGIGHFLLPLVTIFIPT